MPAVGRSEAEPLFVLRPKPWPRSTFIVLPLAAVLWAFAFVVLVASRQFIVAAPALVMLLVPGVIRRQNRLSLTAFDDVLVVVNAKETIEIAREDIADVYVDTPNLSTAIREKGGVGPTIYLRLRSGSTLPLHVTYRKFPDGSLPVNLKQLQEWLRRPEC